MSQSLYCQIQSMVVKQARQYCQFGSQLVSAYEKRGSKLASALSGQTSKVNIFNESDRML